MSTEAKQVNMIEAINMAMDDAMTADPTVIILGEEVADPQEGGVVGVTKGLSTKHGFARVRTTPISEQAIIGAAIGAAIAGMKPIAEIMLMNFTTVAMDMIINHAAKLRFMSGGQTHVPMVIRTMTGAGFATGGQHADFLEAWFAHTAGINVVVPSTPADAYGLMLSCIDDPDPCLFIETLPAYWTPGLLGERGKRIPLGSAKVCVEGSDATVIGYGPTMAACNAAAAKLAGEGIKVEVIDMRSVAPIDNATIFKSVAKTGRAVVVHESMKTCGIGAEVSARITENVFKSLKAPVLRVTSAFCAVPFSSALEKAFVPSADQVEAAIRATLK